MGFYKVDNTLLGFERKISNILFILLCIMLIIVTSLFIFIFNLTTHQRKMDISKEIDSTISLYRYNLSEKLSIIASSMIFIDFYRSGTATRTDLEIRFLTELLPLKANGIIGYTIINSEMGTSYEYGKKSEHFLTLKLCYLEDKLDSDNGKCSGLWKIYFSDILLVNNLFYIKPSIKSCTSCSTYKLTKNGYFGSFPIDFESNSNIRLAFDVKKDNLLYFYLFIVFLLSAFSLLTRIKLHNAIQVKISKPMHNLIEKIKSQAPFNEDFNALSEINYLSKEIEAGRRHLYLINEYEKKSAIANIAATVAHDIRSPVASMEIILRLLSDKVPNDKALMLAMSLQRIRDIANNLLDTSRTLSSQDNETNTESLSGNQDALEDILLSKFIKDTIKQKEYEWLDLKFNLRFICHEDAKDIIVTINLEKIGRILSNLLNNALEASKGHVVIIIHLQLINNRVHLSITDNGIGIPAGKICAVLEGESSKHLGSGIGLSSAKIYMNSIKGELSLRSEMNVGTTIELIFPFK